MSYTPVRHPDKEKLCDFQAFFHLSTWTMAKHRQCISVGNSLAAFLKNQKKRNLGANMRTRKLPMGEKQTLGNISHVLSNMYC